MTAAFRRIVLALALFALGSSCADAEMADGSAELRADVSGMRAEVDRHHESVLLATSLSEMDPELDRHEAAMGSMMGRTRRHMNEMRHCAGAGMMELAHALNEIELEMSFHRQQLEGAPNLDYAHNACSDYAATMADMFDDMMVSAEDGCMHE